MIFKYISLSYYYNLKSKERYYLHLAGKKGIRLNILNKKNGPLNIKGYHYIYPSWDTINYRGNYIKIKRNSIFNSSITISNYVKSIVITRKFLLASNCINYPFQYSKNLKIAIKKIIKKPIYKECLLLINKNTKKLEYKYKTYSLMLRKSKTI